MFLVIVEGLGFGTAFVGCLILGWKRAVVRINMSGHGQRMNTGPRQLLVVLLLGGLSHMALFIISN